LLLGACRQGRGSSCRDADHNSRTNAAFASADNGDKDREVSIERPITSLLSNQSSVRAHPLRGRAIVRRTEPATRSPPFRRLSLAPILAGNVHRDRRPGSSMALPVERSRARSWDSRDGWWSTRRAPRRLQFCAERM